MTTALIVLIGGLIGALGASVVSYRRLYRRYVLFYHEELQHAKAMELGLKEAATLAIHWTLWGRHIVADHANCGACGSFAQGIVTTLITHDIAVGDQILRNSYKEDTR